MFCRDISGCTRPASTGIYCCQHVKLVRNGAPSRRSSSAMAVVPSSPSPIEAMPSPVSTSVDLPGFSLPVLSYVASTLEAPNICKHSGCSSRALKGISFCRTHGSLRSNGGSGKPRYEKFAKKTLERKIQTQLSRRLRGNMEVPCPLGRVDIVTDTAIIEVKRYLKWKNALGQILSYALYFPYHHKQIHLFDIPVKASHEELEKCCNAYGVVVTYEVE